MMSHPRRTVYSALSLVMTASLLLTGCATVKMHPEFNERHEYMRRLAVLPSDIEAYEVTFNAGNKPLADLKALVQEKTSDGTTKILTAKGYEVVNVGMTQADLNSNSALRDAVFDIQTLYQQAIKDMKDHKKKEFTYEIGASPNYFAEKDNVNAIVIMRQQGHRLSQGVISAQIAQTTASIITVALVGVSVGGQTLPNFQLITEIAIVDAELGDILWYHVGQTQRNFTKPEDKTTIFNHLQAILKPLVDSKFKSQQKTKPSPGAGLTDSSAGLARAAATPRAGRIPIKGTK